MGASTLRKILTTLVDATRMSADNYSAEQALAALDTCIAVLSTPENSARLDAARGDGKRGALHAKVALVVVDLLTPVANREGFDGAGRGAKDAAYRQFMDAVEAHMPRNYAVCTKMHELHALYLRTA